MTRHDRIAALKAAARERILVLDGSWGVMFQREGLSEADFRAERFADHVGQMKGNNDILCLTRPDLVAKLHEMYFEAGADISETNTFSATTIAQDDYKLDARAVWDINYEGARIGREVADAFTAKQPDKPRFLAGSMGPLNKMLSMSSDVNDPGARLVDFDEVCHAYREQVKALNEQDMLTIKQVISRLRKYPNDAHWEVVEALAGNLREHLDIHETQRTDDLEFLRTLLRDYIVLTR
jgi:5-methyltetrahydrofolate--homocysteine methyltransferase